MPQDTFRRSREALDALLAALRWPEPLEPFVLSLRAQLAHADAQGLSDVLSSAAVLASEARADDLEICAALDARLRSLLRQLREVARLLQGVESQAHSVSQVGKHMEQAIERQLDELESQTRFASSVESLRDATHRRLGIVRTRFDEGCSKAAVQCAALHSQLTLAARPLRSLEQDVAQAAVSLRRALISGARDRVTELPDAQAFRDQLEYALGWWRERAIVCAVQVWRIDGLSAFTHREHIAAQVGRALMVHVREGDFVSCVGDGEFAVVVQASPEIAAAVGERLRAQVAAAAFRDDQSIVKVTLSAACATPCMEEDAAALLARARTAAAQVEADGGNRYRHVEDR